MASALPVAGSFQTSARIQRGRSFRSLRFQGLLPSASVAVWRRLAALPFRKLHVREPALSSRRFERFSPSALPLFCEVGSLGLSMPGSERNIPTSGCVFHSRFAATARGITAFRNRTESISKNRRSPSWSVARWLPDCHQIPNPLLYRTRLRRIGEPSRA